MDKNHIEYKSKSSDQDAGTEIENESESDDDNDGLDLSDFDFVGIDGEENDVNFNDADMLDMINDSSDDGAPNEQEGFNGALDDELSLNDENDPSERTLGVKLPVNLDEGHEHSDDLQSNDYENEDEQTSTLELWKNENEKDLTKNFCTAERFR